MNMQYGNLRMQEGSNSTDNRCLYSSFVLRLYIGAVCLSTGYQTFFSEINENSKMYPFVLPFSFLSNLQVKSVVRVL